MSTSAKVMNWVATMQCLDACTHASKGLINLEPSHNEADINVSMSIAQVNVEDFWRLET